MSAPKSSHRLRAVTAVLDMIPSGFRTEVDELPQPPPPRWMRWTLISTALATVTVLGCTLLGPMDEFVLASGIVRPAEYALVFPQAGGTVASIEAHAGMSVTKGQVLARLDSADLDRDRAAVDAELAQAEADRALSQAQLEAARESPLLPELLFQARSVERQRQVVAMRQQLLARLEDLGQSNNVSLLELTRERLAVQAAELELDRSRQASELLAGGYGQAQVASAEARVRAVVARIEGLQAKRALLAAEGERRIVRAPADGLVVSRAVRSPGEQAALGAALFKIAYGSGTQLRLYASEDRVNRIKPGMRVRFRTRSDPDRLSPMSLGVVGEVALDRALSNEEAESPEHGASYAIDVSVQQARSELPLGAAVDAEIVLGERAFWRLLMLKREKSGQ